MAGKSFLRKDGKKRIVPTLIKNGVRTLSSAAAGYAHNQVQSHFGDKVKPQASLIGLVGIGTLIEAMVDNEYLQQVGVGMSVIAGNQLFNGVLPEGMKSKVSLSGIDDETDTGGDPLYIPGYNAAASMAGIDDDRWPSDSMAGTGYESMPDLPTMDTVVSNSGAGGGAQKPMTINPGVSGTKIPLVAA